MSLSDGGFGLFQSFDYNEGRESFRTFHLMTQIVGKVRMGLFPERENYQHLTLFADSRGFTTRPIAWRGIVFDIGLDLVDLVCRIRTSDGRIREVTLGQSIAAFYQSVMESLSALGVDVAIRPEPYDIPGETTPFLEDTGEREFDVVTLRRVWQIYLSIGSVLETVASGYTGKITYPQFYWHHVDINSYRFHRSDGSSPELTISSGFWIGDDTVGEPMLFSYHYPAPTELEGKAELKPAGAFWGDNHTALLRYNSIVGSPDPRQQCLDFYRSAIGVFTDAFSWEVS